MKKIHLPRSGILQSHFRPILISCAVLLLLFLLFYFIKLGYQIKWTGFGSSISGEGKQIPSKTLWDWMSLLLVPSCLTIIGMVFTKIKARSDQRIEDERLRELALDHYIDQLSAFILDGNLFEETEKWEKELNKNIWKSIDGHDFEPDRISAMRDIVRAKTLTILPRLDGIRKGIVIIFLHQCRLLTTKKLYPEGKGDNVIVHKYAKIDIENADLRQVQLAGQIFSNVHLPRTDMRKSIIADAYLSGAYLCDAKLQYADLRRIDLSYADLSRANCSKANFEGADLTGARLESVDLCGANLRNANLEGANLKGANCSKANFEGADLTDARLESVDLCGANLRNANLKEANLQDAKNKRMKIVTVDQAGIGGGISK